VVPVADDNLPFELPIDLPRYSPEQRAHYDYAAALRRLAAWLNEQPTKLMATCC
jgi:hypothetical protein